MTIQGRASRAPRFVVAAVVLVVAAAAVLAGRALADTGSGNSSYRTAAVERASVSQTLQRSGTVEPVSQGTIAFPISGTVASVPVAPGQAVTTGQTLAALDTTSLQAALASKEAALAAAQLTLNNALNGISSGSGASSSATRTTATTAPSTATSTPTANTTPDTGALQAARQAVASGQQRVDGALTTANTALAQAGGACANPPAGSTASSTTTTTAPPSTSSSDCMKALQASLAAQQDVASAEFTRAQAQDNLDSLLTSATSSSSASSQSAARTATTAASSSSASSSGPSSAELVADQAAVDAAQADVNAAEQSLAQGTIVSPIDGTVAAVNLTPQQQVSAGSSTANIVVVGPGGYEVTTTVNVDDVGKVKLGDSATVLPDGASSALDGKVVSIGVAPTTNGTTTTYPVVIGLTGSPTGLRNGASTAVTIILSHVADALTVPTSAVRTLGGGGLHVVTVLSGGKTSNVPVQVGAVGADLTEIRSGLQEGQTVVLADLSQALPSNTTTNGRTGLGGGGLGGAGGVVVPGGGGRF